MDKTPIFTESINEISPLAGSGNTRANELDNIKREASRKSERGETVYVVGAKNGSYKLSRYFEKGNTYAAFYNGMPQVVEGLGESINEDAGMVVDVAMGVAAGLMGLWALVQGAPAVQRVFGDAADYLASKAEKKAKMALKNQRKETIAPIIAKFKNDKQLADMYQNLTPYSAAAKMGSSQAGLKAQQGRVNQLTKIGKYIKSKLTPEELVYFRDISAMLRDGDLKEARLNEVEVTNANTIKQILKNSFRFKRTPRGGMLGIPLANNNNDDIERNSTAMQGISNLAKQLKDTKAMNVVSVLQPGATDIEFTVKTDTATYTVNLRAGSVRNSLMSDSSSFWMLLDSIKKSR
jgi:hypothetical protein